MILAAITLICLALLLAQYRAQAHERQMAGDSKLGQDFRARIEALETRRAVDVSRSEFDELCTKVDAMRLAQGLRGAR